MVTGDDLRKTMGKIDSMRTSDLLQVKVPMAFLATGCFSRHRGGSYSLLSLFHRGGMGVEREFIVYSRAPRQASSVL